MVVSSTSHYQATHFGHIPNTVGMRKDRKTKQLQSWNKRIYITCVHEAVALRPAHAGSESTYSRPETSMALQRSLAPPGCCSAWNCLAGPTVAPRVQRHASSVHAGLRYTTTRKSRTERRKWSELTRFSFRRTDQWASRACFHVTDYWPRSTQPGHPSVGCRNEYQRSCDVNRHTARCTRLVSVILRSQCKPVSDRGLKKRDERCPTNLMAREGLLRFSRPLSQAAVDLAKSRAPWLSLAELNGLPMAQYGICLSVRPFVTNVL